MHEENGKPKKIYDLEVRTLKFSENCIDLCKQLLQDNINTRLVDQLVRASTSVGANYREANQTLTKKEFFYRINICRKEAKESLYWLQLTKHANKKLEQTISGLIDESTQLVKIFSSIALQK